MMITYTQEELSSIVHAFAFPGTICAARYSSLSLHFRFCFFLNYCLL